MEKESERKKQKESKKRKSGLIKLGMAAIAIIGTAGTILKEMSKNNKG